MDDAQLRTVWQQRQFSDRVVPLAQPLAILMQHKLAKRMRQFGKLTEIWDEVVPGSIREHTALEGFRNGCLTVAVDTAAHRFQLRNLLDGGLKREIQRRLPVALNKVRVVPGRFYCMDERGEKRYDFDL